MTSLKLNLQESSIKKKRAISFFSNNGIQQSEFDKLDKDFQAANQALGNKLSFQNKVNQRMSSFDYNGKVTFEQIEEIEVESNKGNKNSKNDYVPLFNDEEYDGGLHSSVPTAISRSQKHVKSQKIGQPDFNRGPAVQVEHGKVKKQILNDSIMSPTRNNEKAYIFQNNTNIVLAQNYSNLQRKQPEKEVVSAMVRLNNQGLQVPISIDELKKLPVIPGTTTRILKKKHITDIMPQTKSILGLDSDDESINGGLNQNQLNEIANKTFNNSQVEEETTTVFDLVHRGRQRQQHFRALQKQAQLTGNVYSPKILNLKGKENLSKKNSCTDTSQLISLNAQAIMNKHLLSSQKNLKEQISGPSSLSRQLPKQLSYAPNNSQNRGINQFQEKQRHVRQLIRNFNQEVQSALLPEINSANTIARKYRLLQKSKEPSIQKQEENLSNPQKQTKIQYLHEEHNDPERRVKFTIMNKHKVEIHSSDDEQTSGPLIEDSIINQIKLDDNYKTEISHSTVSQVVWTKLYEAKCYDLSITGRSIKQQERFVTQMLMIQKDHRISFKDQGMGQFSAPIISKYLIEGNDNLQRLDLSCNQFQLNLKPLFNAIKKNNRIIHLSMRNNQLCGQDHADDLRMLVQNHPSLTSIDFGNCELNTNKNKLRNIGAVSLVHGILESKHGQGYSLISEINLSYNYLTQECLPYFAKLCDPTFIQVKNLNLSFNALGSDTIKILEPIIPNLTVLNLNGCKLNNSSMSHLADIFNNERVLLEELYLNNNNITTDGFYRLIVQLKTHNRVRHLNFSHNDIASDITTFSTVQKFLCVNSALEYLDISHCNLNEKAGEAIGKGLRGNRNLQTLILRGNPLKCGIQEIVKSFLTNQKALSLKELDLSKCSLLCQHISQEFCDMIKNPLTTLRVLNIRENIIRLKGGQAIKDALEINKKIIRLPIDLNPIKQDIVEDIKKLCERNREIDEINQKNKNLYELHQKKARSKTQKEALLAEIQDLKNLTDFTIEEVQDTLKLIEKQQSCRKTAIYTTNGLTSSMSDDELAQKNRKSRCSRSPTNHQGFLSLYRDLEPMTAITKFTSIGGLSSFTAAPQSAVQQLRHVSQGPMRSEKVYILKNAINEKIEQLKQEKIVIKQTFKSIDSQVQEKKQVLNKKYKKLKDEKDKLDNYFKEKEEEIEDLDLKEQEIRKQYEDQIKNLSDLTQAIKNGAEKINSELQEVNISLGKERKKYDKFLVRDRERCLYSNDALRQKILTFQTYQNEVKRLKAKEQERIQKELNDREIRLIENQEDEDFMKSIKKSKKKDRTQRGNRQMSEGSFANVKSRLFQSIESSRKKEQPKFINEKVTLFIANREKQNSAIKKSAMKHSSTVKKLLAENQQFNNSIIKISDQNNNVQSFQEKMIMGGGILGSSILQQRTHQTIEGRNKTVIFEDQDKENWTDMPTA